MGGSSLAPALLTHVFGAGGGRHSRPRSRLHRSGRGVGHAGRPGSGGDAVHRLHQVRHHGRVALVPGLPVGPYRGGPEGRRGRPADPAGRLHGRHHRPGQEPPLDPPPRPAARGLPQPARRRRPLLGPDLSSASFPARCWASTWTSCSSRRPGRWSSPAVSRDPARNPGLSLGLAMGAFAQAGPRQADLRHRPRAGRLRAVGRAADRREHRQARRRRRAGGRRAARRPGGIRQNDRVFVRIALPARPARTPPSAPASTPAWPSLPRPVTRSSASRSATRSRPRRRVRPLGGGHRARRRRAGIDPFDQPNVEEAKANTRAVIAAFEDGKGAAARARPS